LNGMKHIMLGTAGHVDHGKTALIKALTGIDTDRLKEEKERGISIELGFASLALKNNQTLGIVDVPGHERFIKNMLSGASGIHLVLLVIAADEGVMPQTREHLQICSLLGISKGIVALTKIDLVDKDWLELVEDDVHKFLKGTFLEDSLMIPVSSVSGEGLDALFDALNAAVADIDEGSDSGVFRLSVDRVFTMRGFGTVVTGTLTSGNVNVGDEVEILPRGMIAKVRGIQIHNRIASEADAGQRTAINLQGIEKTAIERGDILAAPHILEHTRRLDLHVVYSAGHDKKLRNRSLVRFHTGTMEIMGRVILLDSEEMTAGTEGDAQVVFASPIVAMAGDRFVLRSYSPITTIGGGIIVDPLPGKHKRYTQNVKQEFSLLYSGSDADKIAVIIGRAGIEGITIPELAVRTGIHQDIVRKNLDIMVSGKQAVCIDADPAKIVSFDAYRDLQERIGREVNAFHKRYPLKDGVSKEELRITQGPSVSQKLFNTVMTDMEKTAQIVVDREIVRMRKHRVNLQGELEELRNAISAVYTDAGLMPPTRKEVITKFSDRKGEAENVLGVMLKEGILVRISEELYFHKDELQKLRERYKNILLKDGKATPASFKELTGLTRKFVIPLMEYYDTIKLTVRAGDYRILRERDGK
jgi:selenocysteine-specific elongation factor